jgi:hypothetical protein
MRRMEWATARAAFFRPASVGDSAELRREVGLGPPGGVCRLDQRRAQPAVALARLAAPSLAGTLVLTRAQPGPGGKVAWAREAAHIWTDFGHDDLRDATRYTGDGVQSLQYDFKRALSLSDFGSEPLERLVQEIDMRPDVRRQKALVRTEPSRHGTFERGLFVAESPAGEVGEHSHVPLRQPPGPRASPARIGRGCQSPPRPV